MKLGGTLRYTTLLCTVKSEKNEVERYVTLHTTLLCTGKSEKSEVERYVTLHYTTVYIKARKK